MNNRASSFYSSSSYSSSSSSNGSGSVKKHVIINDNGNMDHYYKESVIHDGHEEVINENGNCNFDDQCRPNNNPNQSHCNVDHKENPIQANVTDRSDGYRTRKIEKLAKIESKLDKIAMLQAKLDAKAVELENMRLAIIAELNAS